MGASAFAMATLPRSNDLAALSVQAPGAIKSLELGQRNGD